MFIFDVSLGYGFVLFPLFKKDYFGDMRWLAYFPGRGPFGKLTWFDKTSYNGFSLVKTNKSLKFGIKSLIEKIKDHKKYYGLTCSCFGKGK